MLGLGEGHRELWFNGDRVTVAQDDTVLEIGRYMHFTPLNWALRNGDDSKGGGGGGGLCPRH